MAPPRPVPIVALDFASAEQALTLVDRIPGADFFKVGMQLFTAAGPDLVRALQDRGARIFLDLKFHDIPNTVAGGVRSAASLGVDLLTIHAAGGEAMLRAAVAAAAEFESPPLLFAVTILTSLGVRDLARTWGRPDVDTTTEVVRLAKLASSAGVDGVVASVHEISEIRRAIRHDFPLLSPGIRMTGDDSGDQARVATPADAAKLGADYIVVGRSVTTARDPQSAFSRILRELET